MKVTAFRAGLIWGVLSPVIALPFVWATLRARDPAQPEYNVDVVANGADVSRANGARVLVVNERGRVEQSCNGACDDLRLRELSGGNGYRVEVRDAQGACVVCDSNGDHVTPGHGAWISRFDVAGSDKLSVRQRQLDAE